jgi:V/A-type H+-transporting ATPase subunit A
VSADFVELRITAMGLLQKESELQEIVQLVGPDALPEKEQEILDTSRMIREDFLQQSAFHDVDTYTGLRKQYGMLKAIMKFHSRAVQALELGVLLKEIKQLEVRNEIARMKEINEGQFPEKIKKVYGKIDSEFDRIVKNAGAGE